MEYGKHLIMQQTFLFLFLCVCVCVCLPVGKLKVQWISYSETGKDTKQQMMERDNTRIGDIFPFKIRATASDSDLSYAVLMPEQHHSPSFTSQGYATSPEPGKQPDSNQSSDGKHLKHVSIKSNIGIYSLVQGVASSVLKVLTHRYNNSAQQHGTGGSFTFNDQINFAELKSEQKLLTEQSSEMIVVSIATAVAALFSLSIMAALFGCCCRKKRQTNKSDSRDSLKESSESVTSPSANVKPESSTDADNNAVRNDREPKVKQNGDGNDPVLSVKEKIKAFESQKNIHVGQLTESPRQPKKRPLSEAFKHFETSGILIGMGKSPKPAVEVRGDTSDQEVEEEEIHGTNHNHIPAITEVSPAPCAATIYNNEEEEDISKIYNPDVVIATEDEDEDEFAAIERETEVLKSFRRAAPPRNRNPVTRASRLKLQDELRPQKRDSPAKEHSSFDSISEKIYSVENRFQPDKSANKNTDVNRMASPNSNSHCMLTAVVGTSTEENRTSKSASGSVENVYYLTDPTVKSKSVGDVQKVLSEPKVKNLYQCSGLKDNQKLTEAPRYKMQKDDNKCSTEQKQEDISAMRRERTQSDPSRQSKTFMQAKV